ncbi:MAG TPA: DegV family protein [Eubacteriaceae bacterium]|jgi:DegV family protein with EDD domain|nr:DegV family protein [Eubacteriaceae bacterium]
MSKIQIVTDSTAYLTKDEIKKYNIKVVPLMVHFQGQDNIEGSPGEFEEFFDKLKTSEDFPTTSQPSSGAFAKVFQEAIDEGKEVVTIVISSKLSGTYNSALIAADMVDSEKVTVIDSLTSVANLKHMAIKAHEMAKEGKTREEIEKAIEDQKTKMGIYLTVGTLDYLKKGGRLSGAQAFVGTILNVKPILKVSNGIIEPVGKVRGKKKAIEMMIKNIPEEVKTIYIPQIFNEEEALEIKATLEKKFPKAKLEITDLGPVIGAHLGPKAVGVCFTW